MRPLLPVVLVLAGAASARADTAFYFEETVAAAAYGGDLDAYGDVGLRFTFGFNVRERMWVTQVVGGCILYDGTEPVPPDRGTLCFGGLELRRMWNANKVRPHRDSRAGIRVSLGGGPRYVVGSEALTGFDGPGVSASARLEGDVWVIGYFLSAGVDLMYLSMPVDRAVGVMPFVGVGAKLGWL